MLRCWALALQCGKFVVQQVIELLWACPSVVLYNMSIAGARVVEFHTYCLYVSAARTCICWTSYSNLHVLVDIARLTGSGWLLLHRTLQLNACWSALANFITNDVHFYASANTVWLEALCFLACHESVSVQCPCIPNVVNSMLKTFGTFSPIFQHWCILGQGWMPQDLGHSSRSRWFKHAGKCIFWCYRTIVIIYFYSQNIGSYNMNRAPVLKVFRRTERPMVLTNAHTTKYKHIDNKVTVLQVI